MTNGPQPTFGFWSGYLEILKGKPGIMPALQTENGAVTLKMAEGLRHVARIFSNDPLRRQRYSSRPQGIAMDAAGFLARAVRGRREAYGTAANLVEQARFWMDRDFHFFFTPK
jgi:hypothetical protein